MSDQEKHNVATDHLETANQRTGRTSPTEMKQDIQIENVAIELNEIDLDLLARESIQFKSRATVRLAVVILVQAISTAAFGIDYGTSGIVAVPAFRTYFNVDVSGGRWGIVVAAIYIGNFVASAFVWLSDLIGRRGVVFGGCIITIIGGIIQVTAPSYGLLILGRIFTGAGGALTATVSPMYMSEIAPACWRGRVVGLSSSGGYIGGIIISLVLFGSSYISSNWSWRLPLTVQVVMPLITTILVYPLTPESPRYLMYKGKVDQARKVLAKYHTTAEDPHGPLVNAEIDQIQKSLSRIDTKPWDWTPLWKTKTDRYRLFLIFLYSMFQQWNGSNLFSYYLPAVLTLVGITEAHQQLGLNIGQTAIGLTATIIGAQFFDRVNRRTLLIGAMSLFVFFLVLITITSARFDVSASKPLGYVLILWVYLFDMFNGLIVTPMHSVYPNEVLHFSQRAKGMGMYSLFQALFAIVLTYGGASVIAIIGWKIYFVFIVIDLASIAFTYFFFPEFKSLSLEEIDLVFETPGANPVKTSKILQKSKKERREHGVSAI